MLLFKTTVWLQYKGDELNNVNRNNSSFIYLHNFCFTQEKSKSINHTASNEKVSGSCTIIISAILHGVNRDSNQLSVYLSTLTFDVCRFTSF